MTPRTARFLVSLFPRRWRERYEDEYRQFLLEHPSSVRIVLNIFKEAVLQHAGNVDGDVRHGLRSLTASPAFTTVAVIMLALGIGLNVAVYSVANAALFKGFRSIRENDRILYIGTEQNGLGCCVSYPDFQDWRAQSKTFEDLAAVASLGMTLSDDSGFVDTNGGTEISANGFRLLGKAPLIGRDFEPSDEAFGAPPVTILKFSFWSSRYAQDPHILGRTLRINGVPTTVIAVMPPDFSFPQNEDLWVPLVPGPSLQMRDNRTLWFAFGRLAKGETHESARAEMERIGSRLADRYPRTNRGWIPVPLSFVEFFVSKDAPAIYKALWGAVAFVLLIACANLANLSLARAISRWRETAVRIALGASRWRIIRQLLIENLMLSTLGGVAGWWMAKYGLRIYERIATPPTQNWSEHLMDYSIDYRVFAYFIAITIGTGLLFGLAPALRLLRLDVNSTLKDGGFRLKGGVRGKHFSALLVTAELTLAVVLLAGAGVMVRSFMSLYTSKLGIETSDRITAAFTLPLSRFPNMQSRISFVDRLETRLKGMPEVESIAVANVFPTNFSSRLPFDGLKDPTVSTLVINMDYFRTVGAPVIAGRAFNEEDKLSASPAAIVNQRFVETYWSGEYPIGKTLQLQYGRTPLAITVVGVASNILQNDYFRTRQEFDPLVYLPYWEMPSAFVTVIAKTRSAPTGPVNAFRRELYELDRDLIVIGPSTLEDRLAGYGYYWNTATDSALFLILATTALLLSAIGLYSVVAHSVSQRKHEIGIRMAIGGTASDILRLVFKQAMLPVGASLIIGLAASLALNPILKSMLVKVSPDDPVTLTLTSVVLIVSALLGCGFAAYRAIRIDPAVALKQE